MRGYLARKNNFEKVPRSTPKRLQKVLQRPYSKTPPPLATSFLNVTKAAKMIQLTIRAFLFKKRILQLKSLGSPVSKRSIVLDSCNFRVLVYRDAPLQVARLSYPVKFYTLAYQASTVAEEIIGKIRLSPEDGKPQIVDTGELPTTVIDP